MGFGTAPFAAEYFAQYSQPSTGSAEYHYVGSGGIVLSGSARSSGPALIGGGGGDDDFVSHYVWNNPPRGPVDGEYHTPRTKTCRISFSGSAQVRFTAKYVSRGALLYLFSNGRDWHSRDWTEVIAADDEELLLV